MLGFVSNSTFFLLFFPFSLYVTQAARASDKARPQEYMRGFVSRELSNSAVSETEEESSSYEDGTGSPRSLYCWYVQMFYCYFTPPTAPLLISYPCYRLLDALALHKWSDLTSQYRPGRSLLDS